MPQINIFTYLSQTTWTILLFVLYYINMKQIILPSLLETIKLKNYTSYTIALNDNDNGAYTSNINFFSNNYINF